MYKIHELAEATGLSAATIRYYEREGLFDERHVARAANNYRIYPEEAVARLRLIKKLQSVGFSLAELRDILREPDGGADDNRRIIERIRTKLDEITRKRDEYEHILSALTWMLDYRIALGDDPERAAALLRERPVAEGWHP